MKKQTLRKESLTEIKASSTRSELVSKARKVIDNLPFRVANPDEARFIVRKDDRTFLLPSTKKRFIRLKDKYGNGIDKGRKFKTIMKK